MDTHTHTLGQFVVDANMTNCRLNLSIEPSERSVNTRLAIVEQDGAVRCAVERDGLVHV